MKIKITRIILPKDINVEKYRMAVELLQSAEYPILAKERIYDITENVLGVRPVWIDYEEIS